MGTTKNHISKIDYIIKKINYNSIIMLLLIVAISFALFSISKSSQSNSLLVNKTVNYIVPINEIRVRSLEVLTGYRMFVAGKGKNTLDYISAIGVSKRAYDIQIKKLLKDRELNKRVNIKRMNNNFKKIVKIGKDMALAFMQKDFKNAYKIVNIFSRETKKFENDLFQITSKMTQKLIDQNNKSVNYSSYLQRIVLYTIPLILIITIFLSIRILNEVSLTLNNERQIIKKNIGKTIDDLILSTGNLENISKNLSSTGTLLTKGSNKQILTIDDSINIINQIKKISKKSSANTKKSLSISSHYRDAVSDGTKIISKMAISMEEIKKSNSDLERISEIINLVFKKINLINDIVFQSKLLSFNASVEAARAGDYGKGFAVVAEEISVLTKQSGKSASEISILLKESVVTVKNIIQTLQQRIQVGEKVSRDSVSVFTSIEKMNINQSVMIKQVAEEIIKQDKGLDKTFKSFSSIKDLSEKILDITNQTVGDSLKIVHESYSINKTVSALGRVRDATNIKTELALNNKIKISA